MANKQAKRRKPPKPRQKMTLKLPTRVVKRGVFMVAVLATVMVAAFSARSVLNVPIELLTIEAPFQRVSELQITNAFTDFSEAGFIDIDLDEVRGRIEALDWVDRASVRRVWPNEIEIVVSEQVPAAKWGNDGLLNTRGELFSSTGREDLPELPRLSGPPRRLNDVASRYLALRRPLIEAGLGVRAVTMDARGAWQFVLANGIEVRLGREQVQARADRFIQVAAPVVARHEEKIRHVDMRYSNGFAIGWKRKEFRQQVRQEAALSAAGLQEVVE
ncbi:MAG: cell division protein FtsQ/DivIB [Pseudomonadota bacterium]